MINELRENQSSIINEFSTGSLQTQHGNAVIEGPGDASDDIAGDSAADHSLQTQSRDFVTSGWRQRRYASDLDRNRNEIRETAQGIRCQDNRSRIERCDGSLTRRRK